MIINRSLLGILTRIYSSIREKLLPSSFCTVVSTLTYLLFFSDPMIAYTTPLPK